MTSANNILDGLLSAKSIRMKDPVAAAKKLHRLISGGSNHLQIISDFDYTITKFFDDDGSKCLSTHGIFDAEAGRVNETLGKELCAMKEKFLKIEFDPHLTIEEKTPHMETWWRTAHDMIATSGISRAVLDSFVTDAKVVLREHADQFLLLCEHAAVPLILFSAGIGDFIEIFLTQQLGKVPKNLHLISNMMQYDDKDVVCGFSEPLIHTYCKNSSVISGERTFFDHIKNRPNVMLLGDSMGDIHMDVGVVNEGAVFKIGFLNFDVEHLLPKYLAGYDMVLVEDLTMDVPMKLLNIIIASQKQQRQ